MPTRIDRLQMIAPKGIGREKIRRSKGRRPVILARGPFE
jgi:hypothetical protein